MNNKTYSFRALIILSSFGLWAVLVTARLFYFSVYQENKAKYKLKNPVFRKKHIPALRGRIILDSGMVLAWSERRFYLKIKVSDSDKLQKNIFQHLNTHDLYNEFSGQNNVDISSIEENFMVEISEKNIMKTKTLADKYEFISIIPVINRIKRDDYSRLVGEIEMIDGKSRGISGLEKKYDAELSEYPGIVEFVLAESKNKKNIIDFSVIKKPISGQDVKISIPKEIK